MSSLEYFYGEYGDVEPRFLAELDQSLDPRGPDMLYDVVEALQLGAATRVLDLGCGDGKHECRRVLRPGGHMLMLHLLATDRFPLTEAAWLWSTMHVVPATTDPMFFEAALTAAGLEIQQRVEVGSEWREHREESTGQSRLVHAARLLRQPERYIAEFGQDAYDIMLGDCYWHIYQMLGKFSYRIYVVGG